MRRRHREARAESPVAHAVRVRIARLEALVAELEADPSSLAGSAAERGVSLEVYAHETVRGLRDRLAWSRENLAEIERGR